MASTRTHERGEGKIGCIVTLLVSLALVAVASKVVPVLYSNSSLADTAADLATKAGILSKAAMEQQLVDKAKEQGIPEALPPGAMTISLNGDHSSGTCTIRLTYTRKVDLFGAYTLSLDTEKMISKPYMDVR